MRSTEDSDSDSPDDELEDECQRLSWRMAPERSHSDWTIEIMAATPVAEDEIGDVEQLGELIDRVASGLTTSCYHVHKASLSVGAKRSLYLAKIWARTDVDTISTSTRTTLLLPKLAVDAFPAFLDYMYANDDDEKELATIITPENAAALHHLAIYFQVARLRQKVLRFWKKTLSLDQCGTYYEHAKILNGSDDVDKKLVRLIVQKCCEHLDGKAEWNSNDDRDLSFLDVKLWLEILKANSGKKNAVLLLAEFCSTHQNELDAETFRKLTDETMLPWIRPEDALLWMEVEKAVLWPETVDAELSNLQERCIEQLVSTRYFGTFFGGDPSPRLTEGTSETIEASSTSATMQNHIPGTPSPRPSDERCKALSAEIGVPSVLSFFPIERYYDAAQKIFGSVMQIKDDAAQLDLCYVLAKRYCMFVLEAIQDHTSYGKAEYRMLQKKHTLQAQQVIDMLEGLVDRMDQEFLEQAEQEKIRKERELQQQRQIEERLHHLSPLVLTRLLTLTIQGANTDLKSSEEKLVQARQAEDTAKTEQKNTAEKLRQAQRLTETTKTALTESETMRKQVESQLLQVSYAAIDAKRELKFWQAQRVTTQTKNALPESQQKQTLAGTHLVQSACAEDQVKNELIFAKQKLLVTEQAEKAASSALVESERKVFALEGKLTLAAWAETASRERLVGLETTEKKLVQVQQEDRAATSILMTAFTESELKRAQLESKLTRAALEEKAYRDRLQEMENRLLEAQFEASKWFQTSTLFFYNGVWVDPVAEQRWQECRQEQGHTLPHSIVVTGTDTAINGTYRRSNIISYKNAPRYAQNMWNGFSWTCHEIFLVAERGDPKFLWWMISTVPMNDDGLDAKDHYLYRAQQKKENLIRPPQSGWIPMTTSGSAPPSLTLTYQH